MPRTESPTQLVHPLRRASSTKHNDKKREKKKNRIKIDECKIKLESAYYRLPSHDKKIIKYHVSKNAIIKKYTSTKINKKDRMDDKILCVNKIQ